MPKLKLRRGGLGRRRRSGGFLLLGRASLLIVESSSASSSILFFFFCVLVYCAKVKPMLHITRCEVPLNRYRR